MTQDEARKCIEGIANLAAFAAKARLPIRTLHRIKRGEGQANQTTLTLLEIALKKCKPKFKTEPPPSA